MTIRYTELPRFKDPYLIAAWPGISNVGLGAVGYIVEQLQAKLFAEVDTSDFLLPHKIRIKNGLLEKLEFPYCRFYYKRAKRDLVFLVAEAQSQGDEDSFNLLKEVLDFAELLAVKRIYTTAAAVTKIHHTSDSQVWGIPTGGNFFNYLRQNDCLMMSEVSEDVIEGNITGLNGLLIGFAQSRNIEGICLLGEIPFYISSLPFTYPKASQSIVERLSRMLDLSIDMSSLGKLSREVNQEIEELYSRLPLELREELDKLKSIREPKPGGEEFRKLMKDIEDFLKKGRQEDQNQ